MEYAFYRCTGWPLVSAGLGGYLTPDQMLMEASLMPCEIERDNYHRMLSEVLPFMNEEIRRFFRRQDKKNLNENAYNTMSASIGDRIDEILNIVKSKSNDFMESFSD